jgi:nitroimidazol reductase NimA-like FMN-containing flavoprotein (pyridoxamine 5'-phosphate oxidase superfamily)
MTTRPQPEVDHARTMRSLDREDCLALLATQQVGRLAFTRRALPDIVPVNFVLDREDVLIRLEEDSSVARAVRDAVVAFQVDQLDLTERTGWSVTVVGVAEVDEAAGRDAPPFHPWAPGRRDQYVRIHTDRVEGRVLGPPPVIGA